MATQQLDARRVAARRMTPSRVISSYLGVDGDNRTLNSGRLLIRLKPKAERDAIASPRSLRRLQDAAKPMRGRLAVSPAGAGSHHRRRRRPRRISFRAAGRQCRRARRLRAAACRRLSGAAAISRRLEQRAQTAAARCYVEIDRDSAARYGSDRRDDRQHPLRRFRPADRLDDLHPDQSVSRHPRSGRASRSRARDAGRLRVPTQWRAEMPLASLVTVREIAAPLSIDHLAQFPATTISFNLAPGYSLGAAMEALAAAQARARNAGERHHRLSRRDAGLQRVLGQHAAAHPRRDRHRLYRARRSL